MHCFRTCIYIGTFILQYLKIHYQLFLYLPGVYISTLRLMRGCILTVKLSVRSPISLSYYTILRNPFLQVNL